MGYMNTNLLYMLLNWGYVRWLFGAGEGFSECGWQPSQSSRAMWSHGCHWCECYISFPFFPILIFTLLPSNQWPYMVFLFSEFEVTATQMCKPVMWLINLVMLHTMSYFYSPDSSSESDSANCAEIFTQDFCFEGSCCHCEMEVNGGAAEVNPLFHSSPTLHLHCTYIENGGVNFLLHPL